jgi:hypothetical protein
MPLYMDIHHHVEGLTAEAVASVIAFTSSIVDARASCHHLSNCLMGSLSISFSDHDF